MDELISKLRTALADPYAPWYGSDLVPLVADLIDVATRLRAEIAERLAHEESQQRRLEVTLRVIKEREAEVAEAKEATRIKHMEAVWLQAKLDNAEVQR